MLYVKDIVITIKLDNGQIDLSVPDFLDSDLTTDKIDTVVKLCKASDKNHGTDVVREMLVLCQRMKNGDFGLYRRTIKNRNKIDRLIQLLGAQEHKSICNKKLF